jgi:hypothetical protein
MEKKKHEPIDRLPRNTEYYFIDMRTWKKVCHTPDLYMYSDNMKYEDGNYFLTKEAAVNALDFIENEVGLLEDYDVQREDLDAKFIKNVLSLKDKLCPKTKRLTKKEIAAGKTEPEPIKPDTDAAAFTLLEFINNYTEAKDIISAKVSLTKKDIKYRISIADKV